MLSQMFGISYKDRIRNAEVKTRIRHAIGFYEELLTTVKKRKLKWYGYVSRSTGLTWNSGGWKKEGQAKEKMGGPHHKVVGPSVW